MTGEELMGFYVSGAVWSFILFIVSAFFGSWAGVTVAFVVFGVVNVRTVDLVVERIEGLEHGNEVIIDD